MAAKYIRISEELINECNYLLKTGVRKLPSEEKLCANYNCSRQTIRAALSVLEEKGIIEKYHGSGSFIKDSALKLSQTVFFITRNPNEYIYPEIVRELKSKLSSINYTMETYATNASCYTEREILQSALNQKPAAIILEATSNLLPSPNSDLLDQINKERIPIIYLFTSYTTNRTNPVISFNDRNGAYKLVSDLYTDGSKIGCIFLSDDSRGHSRYLGVLDAYRDLHDENAIPPTYWYTTAEHINMLEGKPIFIDSAIQNLKSCNMVICQNDELAYYINKRLSKIKTSDSGINISSVAGFGNSYYSKQDEGFISIGSSAYTISDAITSVIVSIAKGRPVSPKALQLNISK